jgi:hypothetical protein
MHVRAETFARLMAMLFSLMTDMFMTMLCKCVLVHSEE